MRPMVPQHDHKRTTYKCVKMQFGNKFKNEQFEINVQHVGGKKNPSDIFTKEDRDIMHYEQCRDTLCSTPTTV